MHYILFVNILLHIFLLPSSPPLGVGGFPFGGRGAFLFHVRTQAHAHKKCAKVQQKLHIRKFFRKYYAVFAFFLQYSCIILPFHFFNYKNLTRQIIVPVRAKNYQLSIINYQLSILNYQLKKECPASFKKHSTLYFSLLSNANRRQIERVSNQIADI